MTSTPRIGILAGTVREGRNSIKIADWAQQTLAAAGIDATFEVIDLAAQELGKFTSATPPRMHQGAYEEPELAAWSEKIAGFDGFIFATGEYNGSVPGVMKNAVDSLFVEWTEKPVGFIGWGSTGASSVPIRESARTRMEVMGVFNSWDTLETNSWRDWSTARSLLSDLFTAADSCLVSLKLSSIISASRSPWAT